MRAKEGRRACPKLHGYNWEEKPVLVALHWLLQWDRTVLLPHTCIYRHMNASSPKSLGELVISRQKETETTLLRASEAPAAVPKELGPRWAWHGDEKPTISFCRGTHTPLLLGTLLTPLMGPRSWRLCHSDSMWLAHRVIECGLQSHTDLGSNLCYILAMWLWVCRLPFWASISLSTKWESYQYLTSQS